MSIITLMCASFQPLGPAGPSYPEMAKEAVTKALEDAGVPYDAIEAAVSSLAHFFFATRMSVHQGTVCALCLHLSITGLEWAIMYITLLVSIRHVYHK